MGATGGVFLKVGALGLLPCRARASGQLGGIGLPFGHAQAPLWQRGPFTGTGKAASARPADRSDPARMAMSTDTLRSSLRFWIGDRSTTESTNTSMSSRPREAAT